MKDIASLSHSSWNCKYHIVFAPKYRRMAIYGKIRQDIGVILRRLCEQKGVEMNSPAFLMKTGVPSIYSILLKE